MNTKTRVYRVILAALLLALTLPASFAIAQGNGNGNGNGGSGGGGDTGFEFVELATGQAGSATAYAINNSGIVVGVVDSFAGSWNANEPLPTFTPLTASGFGGARAINQVGEIVGSILGQPTYWADLEGDPIDLPLPEGYSDGEAMGISSDSVVVGFAFTIDLSARSPGGFTMASSIALSFSLRAIVVPTV